MTTINEDGVKRYVLNNYSLSDEVKYEPSEYWYLELYSIVLTEGGDQTRPQKYLVLEYPSYSPLLFEQHVDDCIWSVPFMAYLFQKEGTRRFNTIRSIVDFYNAQIKQNRDILDKLENYRLYHMGISDYIKVEGKQYIEYKVSPRQPDKWKCYYIREFYISGIDRLGLLNLCDPEGLHCYRYYPLVPKPNKEKNLTRFAGKRLSTNITTLLSQSYNQLIGSPNVVSEDMLKNCIKGIVFKLDVVGFTEMYNKICSEMSSLDSTGKELATSFIARLENVFEKRMQEYGISHFVVEGDGLSGAIPIIDNCNIDKYVQTVIDCVVSIKKDINALTKKVNSSVKIRCSMILGEYYYGKLAGLSSRSQMTGELFILLSRMDQHLKEFLQKDQNITNQSIIISVSRELKEISDNCFMHNGFREISSQKSFRETQINSIILLKEA